MQENGSEADNLDNLMNIFASSPDGNSDSTVIHDTDTESEEEEHPVLKKEKPKHNWFIVPEILNRQLGTVFLCVLCLFIVFFLFLF